MAPRGRLFRALSFTITRGKIVQIDVIADASASAISNWRSSTTDEPTYVAESVMLL